MKKIGSAPVRRVIRKKYAQKSSKSCRAILPRFSRCGSDPPSGRQQFLLAAVEQLERSLWYD